MRAGEKLMENYQKSQQWSETFKQEIKQLMAEMTTKNQGISQLSRRNIDLRAFIQKTRDECKQLSNSKIKTGYKIDKVCISIEEKENKLQLLEDILRKKNEWNKELNSRIVNLELDIENEKQQMREQMKELERHEVGEDKEALLDDNTSVSAVSYTHLTLPTICSV